jgi:hypothetical protein
LLCGCTRSAVEPTLGAGDEPRAETASTQATRPARGTPALDIEAEVGALDPAAVKQTFAAAMDGINGCYERGSKRLSFLEGEMEVLLRIDGQGAVRYAVPLESTFGDRETERCIVAELEKQIWPQPKGGREGETRQRFSIRSRGRAAVPWSPADLGSALARLQRELARCPAAVTVTIHVDPDGKPLAAGAAVADEHGLPAIDCALNAAKRIRYPSPGSWPAKVTIPP